MPIPTLNHSPKQESCQSIHLGWHNFCPALSWHSSCQRKKRANILAYILHPPARTVPGMTFAYDHTLRDHTLPYTTLPYIAIRYHTLPYTTMHIWQHRASTNKLEYPLTLYRTYASKRLQISKHDKMSKYTHYRDIMATP